MHTGQLGSTPLRTLWRAAACVVALAFITGCTPSPASGPVGDPEGTAPAEAATDALSVEAGDCTSDAGGENVSDIKVMPCDEPHVFEAFAGTEMPDGDYPGTPAAITAASTFCAGEFTRYVGVEYDSSVLEMLYFYPVEKAWNTADGREILCFVAEEGQVPVTGSLRGARR